MPCLTRLVVLALSAGLCVAAETSAVAAPSTPKAFKVSIPDSEIKRTKSLLQTQRLPSTTIVPGADLGYGAELSWMKTAKNALVNFDWRAAESTLNSFKQYTVTIEGTTIHYIYEKSSAKNAIPLLLLHGWGSTVSEFNKVVKPLTNPPSGQQAFDVIAPSLPGVGYSSVVPKVNATVEDNARIFDTLVTKVLGYKTYVAQGGDFGAINLRQIQTKHADTMKLALFEGFPASRPANATDDTLLPSYEQHLLDLVAYFQAVGTGYLIEQTTKVSTIGLTLYDHPQGFLSYLGEKYVMIQNWANFTSSVNATFLDDLLTVILYQQYTNTIHTGMAMYKLNGNKYIFDAFTENPSNQAPFGVHHFEGEFFLSPKSWIAQQGPLIWHAYHPRGGHFGALGYADAFVADCREFFGTYYWQQPGVAPKTA
ncbi:alpha/beta-hydrolase [Ceratobasidium sp. AG-I]|nr:alpha/beta-hydrolase [Ceratobasidium sp. AG-I]